MYVLEISCWVNVEIVAPRKSGENMPLGKVLLLSDLFFVGWKILTFF